MVEEKAVWAALQNGNNVANKLSNQGLFVEAGVVTSLLLVIQSLWKELHPPQTLKSVESPTDGEL